MLHHPNAVVIHDFGEDKDGTAYIVMELLVGRSLRQLLIDEGLINSKRAYGIVRQACAALDAGHRNGIVHRDIKPDNVILLDSHDGADHVKILDFGLARFANQGEPDENHACVFRRSISGSITGWGTQIEIVPDAQESHTYLQTHSMLLSAKAKADAIPSLIVKTDNVSASHGGTVGELDEEQIFYMTTRGLPRPPSRPRPEPRHRRSPPGR